MIWEKRLSQPIGRCLMSGLCTPSALHVFEERTDILKYGGFEVV